MRAEVWLWSSFLRSWFLQYAVRYRILIFSQFSEAPYTHHGIVYDVRNRRGRRGPAPAPRCARATIALIIFCSLTGREKASSITTSRPRRRRASRDPVRSLSERETEARIRGGPGSYARRAPMKVSLPRVRYGRGDDIDITFLQHKLGLSLSASRVARPIGRLESVSYQFVEAVLVLAHALAKR